MAAGYRMLGLHQEKDKAKGVEAPGLRYDEVGLRLTCTQGDALCCLDMFTSGCCVIS